MFNFSNPIKNSGKLTFLKCHAQSCCGCLCKRFNKGRLMVVKVCLTNSTEFLYVKCTVTHNKNVPR